MPIFNLCQTNICFRNIPFVHAKVKSKKRVYCVYEINYHVVNFPGHIQSIKRQNNFCEIELSSV